MKRCAVTFALALVCSSSLHAATFTVTRTDDPVPDGCRRFDCSLREAVIAANKLAGSDVIALGVGTYQLSRTTSGDQVDSRGPLRIRDAVEIKGAGASKTRVRWTDSSFLSRGMRDGVFYVWHDETVGPVQLRNMSISHGRGDSGGCVSFARQYGEYALSDVVIEQCHALNGGGVSVNGSFLEMSRVHIRDNSATYDGGGLSAIRASMLWLEAVEIYSNAAGRHGGGVNLAQFDWNNPSALEMHDRGGSRVFRNEAGANGGGVAVAGDVNVFLTGNLDPLQIDSNIAAGDGGGVWRGPRYIAAESSLFLAHADIGGNRALRGAGVAAGANTALTLQNVSLVKNLAQDGGGGLHLAAASTHALLQHVSVHGNSAATGGGIAAGCGSATLQNVSMQYNHATQGAAIDSGGRGSLTHVTVHDNTGTGIALLVRDDTACDIKHFVATNSLIADSCHVAHPAAFSDGGNQYGPASISCPVTDGVDQRQASSAVFGLTVSDFGAPFPVTGWLDDGTSRPQQDFVAPGSWCLVDDVRGQPRSDGACDSGAFEAQ